MKGAPTAHVASVVTRSKLKAVNNRDKNFTPAKMKRRMEQINESIERYLRAMDTADRAEPEVAALKEERLQEKIEALKEQMGQILLADPSSNRPNSPSLALIARRSPWEGAPTKAATSYPSNRAVFTRPRPGAV